MSEDEMRKEENLEHEVLDRLKNLEPMDFDYNALDASYVDATLKARDIILDLYQKEKEKNKELSNLSENIKIFREKNLSAETKYVIALNSNYMNYLKLDYISKDKIKKAFDVKIHNFNYLSETDWDEAQKAIDKGVANILENILQELLGGNNENIN